MRRLTSERGLAGVIATFAVLVSVSMVLSALALSQAERVAHPSDRDVVARLQRGVRVMTRGEARAIIGGMLRRAGRYP